METLRLRQICLVARNKLAVVQQFADLLDLHPVHGSGDLSGYGLPAKGPMFEGGHRLLESLGVENLIFGAGTDFVEVLFPVRAEGSTVRLLERRGGDTGYMVILQSDDVEAIRRRGEEAGVRVIYQANYPQYRDVHFHPKDTGGALLSVARNLPENIVDGPWYPAGTAWETLPRSKLVSGLAAVELQSAGPEAVAARWSQVLGRTARPVGNAFEIIVDDGVLRFVTATDGRGEGFSGFDLRVHDPAAILAAAERLQMQHDGSTVVACGMRVNLVSG